MAVPIKQIVCYRFSIQKTRNNMEKEKVTFVEELRGV